jgi:hypothetical protein
VNLLTETLGLYRDALRKTGHSLVRGWIVIVAVILFALAMVFATSIAAPLGLAGGFILGAVNAVLIGATLSLIGDAVLTPRAMSLQDIRESFGQHFWDVMGVGFVLWIPLMVLERGMAANPDGAFFGAAIFLLLFILLNPTPEIIYQVRHGSPLDVFRESYEFVVENWIEWFLPLAIVLAPLGLSFFVAITGRMGRGAGLDFFQLLVFPFTLLTAWLGYVGVSPQTASVLVWVLTPPLAIGMMFFRGHLFAALHGSSRRQRRFAGIYTRE